MRPERALTTSSDNPVRLQQLPLRIVIPASELSVRCGLMRIKAGVAHLGLSPDDLSTVELVLAEVLNNIVEHAYRDIENGIIELELSTHAGMLVCTILDDGHPMPNERLPHGHPVDLSRDITNLPEGGFGWFLIHQLTSDLSYHRQGSKNIFTCQLAVGLIQQAI